MASVLDSSFQSLVPIPQPALISVLFFIFYHLSKWSYHLYYCPTTIPDSYLSLLTHTCHFQSISR